MSHLPRSHTSYSKLGKSMRVDAGTQRRRQRILRPASRKTGSVPTTIVTITSCDEHRVRTGSVVIADAGVSKEGGQGLPSVATRRSSPAR